jgi:hypothetical protein
VGANDRKRPAQSKYIIPLACICIQTKPNLALHALVPHPWKTPANQDTHMVTHSHTSYTYKGTISTVSIGRSTLLVHCPTPISTILYCTSIEVWPLARGFLQSFASCSSWPVLQAVAAACSSAWDTAAARPLATTAARGRAQ